MDAILVVGNSTVSLRDFVLESLHHLQCNAFAAWLSKAKSLLLYLYSEGYLNFGTAESVAAQLRSRFPTTWRAA